jgi:hypothetical protein
MNTSFSDILKAIEKYAKPETVKPEILFTSGNRTRDWLNDRITYNTQILINAIAYDEEKHYRPYEQVIHDIETEFSPITKVKCLPFPYDDLKEMNIVIGQLIEHFGANFLSSDVTIEIDRKSSDGYLIVTIILTSVIK